MLSEALYASVQTDETHMSIPARFRRASVYASLGRLVVAETDLSRAVETNLLKCCCFLNEESIGRYTKLPSTHT